LEEILTSEISYVSQLTNCVEVIQYYVSHLMNEEMDETLTKIKNFKRLADKNHFFYHRIHSRISFELPS
jgi:hypothetical protein